MGYAARQSQRLPSQEQADVESYAQTQLFDLQITEEKTKFSLSFAVAPSAAACLGIYVASLVVASGCGELIASLPSAAESIVTKIKPTIHICGKTRTSRYYLAKEHGGLDGLWRDLGKEQSHGDMRSAERYVKRIQKKPETTEI